MTEAREHDMRDLQELEEKFVDRGVVLVPPRIRRGVLRGVSHLAGDIARPEG